MQLANTDSTVAPAVDARVGASIGVLQGCPKLPNQSVPLASCDEQFRPDFKLHSFSPNTTQHRGRVMLH